MDLEKEVNECELHSKFIAGLLMRGCAEKETTMAMEGTGKGGVNFHRELNTVFGLHWTGEPKVARWP